VGPPAAALGANGNYYLDTTAHWLYGPKGGPGFVSSVFGAPPPSTTTDGNVYSMGRRFTFNVPGVVTGLRWYRPAGIATTVRFIRLWTDAGALLGTVQTLESGIGWQAVNFVTPVAVTAGQVVRVAYDQPINQPIPFQTPIPASASSDFTGGNGCFVLGGGFPSSLDVTNAYFADVLFQPTWPVALKSAA
jgi:hypothetical protein